MISFKAVQSKKGFTMIELLVAIAIIAVLSAVGLTTFTGAQKKSRDARRTEDMNKVRDAAEQYFGVNNAYPSGLTALADKDNFNTWVGGLSTYTLGVKDPIDAAIGANTYQYLGKATAGSLTTTYCLCALLEQGSGGNSSTSSCAASPGGTYYCVRNSQ